MLDFRVAINRRGVKIEAAGVFGAVDGRFRVRVELLDFDVHGIPLGVKMAHGGAFVDMDLATRF